MSMGKTTIHNFGKFGAILSDYTARDGMTVTYDERTYERLLRMSDEQFEEARYEEARYTMRKAVRAAYAVAQAERNIRNWRNR
jgi:uncharacterized protein YjiS (DUF1127 family)